VPGNNAYREPFAFSGCHAKFRSGNQKSTLQKSTLDILPSTLSHQPESNNSINTSKIKNRYSIFLLQHLFQTLPGHICNPLLHPSSQLQLKLPCPFFVDAGLLPVPSISLQASSLW